MLRRLNKNKKDTGTTSAIISTNNPSSSVAISNNFFDSLPDELIVMIMMHLMDKLSLDETQALAQFKTTCRRFYNLAKEEVENPHYPKRFYQFHFPQTAERLFSSENVDVRGLLLAERLITCVKGYTGKNQYGYDIIRYIGSGSFPRLMNDTTLAALTSPVFQAYQFRMLNLIAKHRRDDPNNEANLFCQWYYENVILPGYQRDNEVVSAHTRPRTGSHTTLLHWAAILADEKTLQILIQQVHGDADNYWWVHLSDHQPLLNPVHCAAKYCNTASLRVLTARTWDRSVTPTPFWCAEQKHFEAVPLVLRPFWCNGYSLFLIIYQASFEIYAATLYNQTPEITLRHLLADTRLGPQILQSEIEHQCQGFIYSIRAQKSLAWFEAIISNQYVKTSLRQNPKVLSLLMSAVLNSFLLKNRPQYVETFFKHLGSSAVNVFFRGRGPVMTRCNHTVLNEFYRGEIDTTDPVTGNTGFHHAVRSGNQPATEGYITSKPLSDYLSVNKRSKTLLEVAIQSPKLKPDLKIKILAKTIEAYIARRKQENKQLRSILFFGKCGYVKNDKLSAARELLDIASKNELHRIYSLSEKTRAILANGRLKTIFKQASELTIQLSDKLLRESLTTLERGTVYECEKDLITNLTRYLTIRRNEPQQIRTFGFFGSIGHRRDQKCDAAQAWLNAIKTNTYFRPEAKTRRILNNGRLGRIYKASLLLRQRMARETRPHANALLRRLYLDLEPVPLRCVRPINAPQSHRP